MRKIHRINWISGNFPQNYFKFENFKENRLSCFVIGTIPIWLTDNTYSCFVCIISEYNVYLVKEHSRKNGIDCCIPLFIFEQSTRNPLFKYVSEIFSNTTVFLTKHSTVNIFLEFSDLGTVQKALYNILPFQWLSVSFLSSLWCCRAYSVYTISSPL